MFAFNPNPNYVPGGVNNFWVSGNGCPPAGEAENGANSAGSVEQGIGAGGCGFGVSMRNMWSNQQKEEPKKEPKKEPLLGKIGGLMENFAPLVNTYNI